MTGKPVISVIIPAWNAGADMAACLDALAAQSLDKDAFEVVVVDNGSTDNTGDIVRRYPDFRLLHEPSPGSYRARNHGLAKISGDYVAFTDADCVPDQDWLRNGLAKLQGDDGVGIVAGHVEFFKTDPRPFTASDDFETLFSFDQEKNVREGSSVTANWMSPTGILREQSGFRADLKSGGDFELSRRLRAGGHRLVFGADVIVRHPLRSSFSATIAKARRVSGGQLIMLGRAHWRTRLRKTTNTLIARTKKVLKASALPFGRKLRLLNLLAILYVVSVYEILRIRLGGEPRRA